MGQLQQLTLGMRGEIARARNGLIGTPFTRFRRAAREMARATGKRKSTSSHPVNIPKSTPGSSSVSSIPLFTGQERGLPWD